MRRVLSFAGAALMSAVCLLQAATASAQAPPTERRLPDLFGSGAKDGRQQLDLTVSALAANDDDIIQQDLESGFGGLSPQKSSSYESLSFQLGYVRRFRESTFAATARSVAQHFQGLGNSIGFQRALSVGYNLSHRGTRIAVDQSANEFPLFALQPVPSLFSPGVGELPPPVADEAVAAVPARRYITSADVSQAIGPRLTLAASARLVSTTLDGGAASLRQDIASAHLTYHVARDLGFVAGYGIQQGAYRFAALGAGTDRIDLQNIDLGLNYNHALSFSRRTTVSFSSGPVLVRNPVDRTTQYTMGGEARLNHQMGRSWQATTAYTRGVTFMDGFTAPFLGDTVALNIAGNLQRRVTLTMGGGYWTGRMVGAAVDETSERNESLTGTARLSIALSPSMALSAEYRYFHYRFPPTLVLFGMPLWGDRGSLRVGFDVHLPLFN